MFIKIYAYRNWNLNCRDVLPLLYIDVSNVQPNVTKVSSGLTDLLRYHFAQKSTNAVILRPCGGAIFAK